MHLTWKCYVLTVLFFMRILTDLRIAATVFDSHKCMMVTDANVVLLRVNQAFAISTGYSTQEAVGQNPSFISSGRHEADFYAAMWESINRTGEWKGDIWNKRKSGEVYQEYVHITAVKNELGEVTNYISVSST